MAASWQFVEIGRLIPSLLNSWIPDTGRESSLSAAEPQQNGESSPVGRDRPREPGKRELAIPPRTRRSAHPPEATGSFAYKSLPVVIAREDVFPTG